MNIHPKTGTIDGIYVDDFGREVIDTKRKCKYCGEVHKYAPFIDCHNPSEPLPDSLEDGYKRLGYS